MDEVINQNNAEIKPKNKGGRPFGSKTRPQIRDFFTKAEIKELVDTAKSQYKDKPELLKHLIDHVFGRAQQPIDMTSGGDKINEIRIRIVEKKEDVENKNT